MNTEQYQNRCRDCQLKGATLVYRRFLRALLPARCPGCGGAAEDGFCDGCRDDLERVELPCTGCGRARPVTACPRVDSGWHIAGVVAPFSYTEPLQGYVQSLKFAGRRSLGWALGTLLASHVASSPTRRDVNAIVAVPLHRQRFIARGYNQAIEIARAVSAELSIPLLVAGVGRSRATAAQTGLLAAQRRANLRGAFSVSRDLEGLHVAIIDDVMTTGATVNALAVELARAGAESVYVWAVARSL